MLDVHSKAMHLSTNKLWIFGIVVLFLLQIPFLIAPPEGPMLFWREAITNMIAENLAFEDATFLRPTVDYRSPLNRVFSSEFPIYNGIIAVAMRVFGFAHNYGRFLSFFSYIVGIFAFFSFLKEEERPEKEVIFATVLLAFSSWFTHSTRIFPDLFATSAILVSVLFGARFLRTGKLSNAILFILFAAFGGLSKMPVFMVLGFLAFPWLHAPLDRKLKFLGFGILAVAPAIGWYFFWLPHIEAEGASKLMFPTSISEGFHQIFYSHWEGTKLQFSYYLFNGTLMSILSLLGLLLSVKKNNWFWGGSFIATLPLLFLLMFKSGYTFATHYYYVIPIVPLASGLAAVFLDKVPKTAGLVLLLFGAIYSVKYKAEESTWTPKSYFKVEETVNRLDPSGGPIASGFDHDPRFTYYSRREAFALWEGQFKDPNKRKEMLDSGVKLLVLPAWPPYTDTVPYPQLYRDIHAVYYDYSGQQ